MIRKLIFTDIKNLARIKWIWLYFLFLVLGSFVFNYVSGDETKVLISLLSISLLVIPLISSFFGITYLYDSKNFIEFLLSQPISRKKLLFSKYLSLSLFLSSVYLLGVIIPFLPNFYSFGEKLTFILLIISGVFLNFVFTAIAFLVGVSIDEKAKGVSLILGIWLYLTFLHDGLILAIIYVFKDYPLEKVVLFLSVLNPVDLARILVVLNLDISALMGITGTVFKSILGSYKGVLMSLLSLIFWVFIPFSLSLFIFNRRDL